MGETPPPLVKNLKRFTVFYDKTHLDWVNPPPFSGEKMPGRLNRIVLLRPLKPLPGIVSSGEVHFVTVLSGSLPVLWSLLQNYSKSKLN